MDVLEDPEKPVYCTGRRAGGAREWHFGRSPPRRRDWRVGDRIDVSPTDEEVVPPYDGGGDKKTISGGGQGKQGPADLAAAYQNQKPERYRRCQWLMPRAQGREGMSERARICR